MAPNSMNGQNAVHTLGYSFQVTQTPDDRVWVAVTINLGVASFTWGLPVDQALDFLRDFNEGFRMAQADGAKLARGIVVPGLIVPGQQQG